MSEEKLEALRKMVKQRVNIDEARNALHQLLKRNAIEPDDVLEFIEAYQKEKELKQPLNMPQTIKCYIAINYSAIQEAIRKGYSYSPMVASYPYSPSYYDEVFEVDLPLSGYKQITAKVAPTKDRERKE